MQAAILISVHIGFIVAIKSLNITIQENTISQRSISKMLIVLAKMFIQVLLWVKKPINLTIQANTT